MRILLLSVDFLPSLGGVSLMMHHLATALVHTGHEVLVAPPLAEGEVEYEQPYGIVAGDRETWVDRGALDQLSRRRRLRRVLASVVESFGPDAMLLGDQAYDGRFSDASIWAQRRYNVTLTLYCHGFDIRSKMVGGKQLAKELVGSLLGPVTGVRSARQRVWGLVHAADTILANSSYTANLVRRWAGREAVATGCGLTQCDWEWAKREIPEYALAQKREARAALGLRERPTVGFLGRLVSRKNLPLLLDSLSHLPDAQLVIAGEGRERTSLEAHARSLGVEDRVIWLGACDEASKWRVLSASDVFCLPAIEGADGGVEGFGIVLLEASAAGTPVVAASSGGMTDVIDHERTGLLCSGRDADEIASMIRRFIEDQSLAQTCVSHAREQIEKRFNWIRVATTVSDQLQAAVRRRAAAH